MSDTKDVKWFTDKSMPKEILKARAKVFCTRLGVTATASRLRKILSGKVTDQGVCLLEADKNALSNKALGYTGELITEATLEAEMEFEYYRSPSITVTVGENPVLNFMEEDDFTESVVAVVVETSRGEKYRVRRLMLSPFKRTFMGVIEVLRLEAEDEIRKLIKDITGDDVKNFHLRVFKGYGKGNPLQSSCPVCDRPFCATNALCSNADNHTPRSKKFNLEDIQVLEARWLIEGTHKKEATAWVNKGLDVIVKARDAVELSALKEEHKQLGISDDASEAVKKTLEELGETIAGFITQNVVNTACHRDYMTLLATVYAERKQGDKHPPGSLELYHCIREVSRGEKKWNA